MNNNKKADNLSYNKRKTINDLDNKIYDNKKKVNELVKMQESLISLDFCINDCINLLSKSMKSERDSTLYSDIQETNRKNLFSSLDIIESNVDALKKDISNLREKKDMELRQQDDEQVDSEKY